MARTWWTLTAVSVATFMLLLDITVVNVALPSIHDDLGGSFSDLQWVVDASALTLAALVLTAGSLADRLGRRRLFAWGLGIFSGASLLCALAPDPTFLNLARALQGIGGAVMFAVSLALVAQEFPGVAPHLPAGRVQERGLHRQAGDEAPVGAVPHHHLQVHVLRLRGARPGVDGVLEGHPVPGRG